VDQGGHIVLGVSRKAFYLPFQSEHPLRREKVLLLHGGGIAPGSRATLLQSYSN